MHNNRAKIIIITTIIVEFFFTGIAVTSGTVEAQKEHPMGPF